VRFYRTKDDPAACAWLPGDTDGDVGTLQEQHTLRVPKGPSKIDAGPAGSKGRIGMQWAAMGPGLGQQRPRPVRSTRQISDPLRREGDPLRCGRSTQQRSVPLALASLVLGSRRSETGLFEIGFGELARARRGHEALFTRRGRIDASTSTHRRPTQPLKPVGFCWGPPNRSRYPLALRLQTPRNQRSLCGPRVLLQSEYRLLGQALVLGDGR
jgi:hypothetical protein